MTHKETERLITKYLNGETSVEEEKRLALEVMREDAPQEWKFIATMLGELATDEALFDRIMEEREARRPAFKVHRNWWWAAAACLLLVVSLSFSWMNNRMGESSQMAKVSAVGEKGESIASGGYVGNASSPSVTMASEVYQDPVRVTRFIEDLAKIYNADSLDFDCSESKNTHSLEIVYVFADNKEHDVIGKLLQVACWYDNSQPGYRLSLTNNQFIFELEDKRKNMHFLWMAERVRGNILLHCSHAAGNFPAISTCYREFRNELENNPFMINNHKTVRI